MQKLFATKPLQGKQWGGERVWARRYNEFTPLLPDYMEYLDPSTRNIQSARLYYLPTKEVEEAYPIKQGDLLLEIKLPKSRKFPVKQFPSTKGWIYLTTRGGRVSKYKVKEIWYKNSRSATGVIVLQKIE